mgnify:FL=1
MKRLGLLALMLAGIAPAWATDYVLVYYPQGNVTYTCNLLPSYLNTEGDSRLDFSQCDVLVTDYMTWPVFPFMPVKLTLSGPAFKRPNVRQCSSVAQADGLWGTSPVVVCRGAG